MARPHSFWPSPDTCFAFEDRMRSPPATHTPRQNHLLAALPRQDYERLLPDLDPFPLPMGGPFTMPATANSQGEARV